MSEIIGLQRWIKLVKNLFQICGLIAVCSATLAAPAGGGIDFNRDIRTILSDNCFSCHGPDEQQRKAKLRLDVREEALKPMKSGDRAIVPGNVSQSKLVERIETTDEDDLMPPPKSGKKLSKSQINLLKQWIAAGAKYQEHWAFTKAERPAVPSVKNSRWAKNDLDRFVLSKLEKEGLNPSPEADKATLIRRASLDLRGLPPTPAEVDSFLSDKRPEAYETLVDKLLDSAEYGEQMGRVWLDAARYADSHGYHIDSDRSMWKYREWVINAFNKNMPFDEFTVEQLAGDLLPSPTLEQKIASGYIRCNMSTGEGGAIVEEYQAKYTFDRVETTGTIWLGMTLTCARCHTHKFDPITHKEYYSLYSIFNNLDESVMDGNQPRPDPFVKVPSMQQTSRKEELKKSIAQAQTEFDAPIPEIDRAQEKWQHDWKKRFASVWMNAVPALAKSGATNGAQLKVLEDHSILAEGPKPEQDIYEITVKPGQKTVSALKLEAIPHDSLPKKSASRAEDGKFRLSEFEVERVVADKPAQKVKLGQAFAAVAEKDNEIQKAIDGKPETGWSVTASEKGPQSAIIEFSEPLKLDEQESLLVRLRFEKSGSTRALGHFRLQLARGTELAEWLHPPKFEPWSLIGPFKTDNIYTALDTPFPAEKELKFDQAYPGVRDEVRWNKRPGFEDGKSHVLVDQLHGVHGVYLLHRTITLPQAQKVDLAVRADDVFKVFVNGKVVAERRKKETPGEGPLRFTVNLDKGENKVLLKIANEVNASSFSFGRNADDVDTLPAEIAGIFVNGNIETPDARKKLQAFYRKASSPKFKELAQQLDRWREEDAAIEKNIPTTMVAKERKDLRETFVLLRGEYDKKGDKVLPGLPSILPPLPKDQPTNRLGFAKWLMDPNHPLTARVTVNRFWQQYFGTGLVKTAEDFGVQGEYPSNPALLDWLATEFQNGWDVKKMQKLIVTSATYRQSSRVTPALLAKDPENRLLARGPRFRVDAEVVRDTALAVSGLLVKRVGGASVKPYEPGGLWEAVSFNNSQKYIQDTGDNQYRRSLYTHWKRQSPPPNMLLLDAPTREFCVVRRPRTNTPLQALALLNDPQFVEASRAFAQRLMLEGGATVEQRLAYGFKVATARKPASAELKILVETFKAELAAYNKNPEAAGKFLQVGEFKPDSRLNQSELAAWTTIANMLLNLDETLTKS